jgi:tetratricopeptide (TPR) repeat protein
MARALENIGAMYHQKGEHDKALDYFHRSLKILESSSIEGMIGVIKYNIGAGLLMKKQFDEALKSSLESLSISKMTGDKLLECAVYLQIGKIHQKSA